MGEINVKMKGVEPPALRIPTRRFKRNPRERGVNGSPGTRGDAYGDAFAAMQRGNNS